MCKAWSGSESVYRRRLDDMYVCVCVCVCVCACVEGRWSSWRGICRAWSGSQTCIHIYTYIHTGLCTRRLLHSDGHSRHIWLAYIHTYIHIYIHTGICQEYLGINIPIHTYIHTQASALEAYFTVMGTPGIFGIHTYIYAYIHTYIHTHRHLRWKPTSQ
jgi:hypothetical protein